MPMRSCSHHYRSTPSHCLLQYAPRARASWACCGVVLAKTHRHNAVPSSAAMAVTQQAASHAEQEQEQQRSRRCNKQQATGMSISAGVAEGTKTKDPLMGEGREVERPRVQAEAGEVGAAAAAETAALATIAATRAVGEAEVLGGVEGGVSGVAIATAVVALGMIAAGTLVVQATEEERRGTVNVETAEGEGAVTLGTGSGRQAEVVAGMEATAATTTMVLAVVGEVVTKTGSTVVEVPGVKVAAGAGVVGGGAGASAKRACNEARSVRQATTAPGSTPLNLSWSRKGLARTGRGTITGISATTRPRTRSRAARTRSTVTISATILRYCTVYDERSICEAPCWTVFGRPKG